MRSMKLSELVFDISIYPRERLDQCHVYALQQADEGGAKFPPYVIDKRTRRVVDGFHRGAKDRRLYGEDHKVEVVEKTYDTDAQMFLDAIRLNSGHGLALSPSDRVHCVSKANTLKIKLDTVASAMTLTCDALSALKVSVPAVSRQVHPARPIGGQRMAPVSEDRITEKKDAFANRLNERERMPDEFSPRYFARQLVKCFQENRIRDDDAQLIDELHWLFEYIERLFAHLK